MFTRMFRIFLNYIYSIIDRYENLKVKLLDYNAREPVKGYQGSAGYDVFATSNVTIPVGKRRLIPLGISVEIPKYYYIRIAPRSGLSVRGIDIGAGVIDSSYRGELQVLLINNSESDFEVLTGDKIAQLIITRCSNSKVDVVDILDDSERGARGFGSTGN